MDSRPGWDQYFLNIAKQVAERSTCLRAKIGAVIVCDKRILATGYNGAPSGIPHCLEVGCFVHETRDPEGLVEQNCLRTIHAEINAIVQAARHGISIEGASIYLTHSPCVNCLKVIINAGIKIVHYGKVYKPYSPFGESLINLSGIKMETIQQEC
ncbi:MAG: dCMP deaminase family protein [bacterium]|nr:dCMP deaminase family protein [bacterium]